MKKILLVLLCLLACCTVGCNDAANGGQEEISPSQSTQNSGNSSAPNTDNSSGGSPETGWTEVRK